MRQILSLTSNCIVPLVRVDVPDVAKSGEVALQSVSDGETTDGNCSQCT